MGVEPPFMYRPVKSDKSTLSSHFDPKAVSRASFDPSPSRPKQQGPLISFNQHPDSYLIVPYGKTNAKPMNPSVKKWIKWMRIFQLVLRCFEILCSVGLLCIMILLKGTSEATNWIMRVVPGVAILHTVYAIYHLGRKPSGRTPGSSASYMLFASFFDISIVPFYAFSALVAMQKQNDWSTLLTNQSLTGVFSKIVFYLATVGGALFLVSLAISLYLAVTFRKITKLPPDMNPLEDNLTSRHKRNKSSISTSSTMTENRNSTLLETKGPSGAAYEQLSRPPSIPFLHTRTTSTNSFSTYKSTPSPSRDGRADLPSRQYQINSPRSSVVDIKRSSGYGASSPKRTSYTEIPISDSTSLRPSTKMGNVSEASWYTAESLSGRQSRSPSPKKAVYQPLRQQLDYFEEISDKLPNPLEANPPTQQYGRSPKRDSALSEISINRSGDVTDVTSRFREGPAQTENFKAKYYGELNPGTPPIMVGGKRQVSSGNDISGRGDSKMGRRDVSGKIAEEGRGGVSNAWGTRFRRISGLGGNA